MVNKTLPKIWGGTHYVKLLHMLRHFDPPFSGLWKFCIVSTLYFSENEENVVLQPLFFIKIGQNV